MPTSFALFCTHCGAVLLRHGALRAANSCPACGARVGVGGAPARGGQLRLPSGERRQACPGAGRLWLAGAEALWRLTLTDGAPHLASFPLPERWQAAGLVETAGRLVFAPTEFRPAQPPKALLGLDVHTAQVVWRREAQGSALTPPAAEAALVCTVDSLGNLLAVRPFDGQLLWSQSLGDYPHKGLGPALTPHLVLAVDAQGALRAFDRQDGAPRWNFRPPGGEKLDFSPLVSGDSAYVLAGAAVYRISLIQGAWEQIHQAERRSTQGWYFAPPVADEERLFLLEACWDNNNPAYALRALEKQGGQVLWQRSLTRHPHQAPLLLGETLYFIEREGRLLALEAANGKPLWEEMLDGEPALPPSLLGEHLVTLTIQGTLSVFRPAFAAPLIDQPPSAYLAQGELWQAAAAFLRQDDPIGAGLALMQADDWAQARLAFRQAGSAALRASLAKAKTQQRDADAGRLSEAQARLDIETPGSRARGKTSPAERLEKAAAFYIQAGLREDAQRCREEAARRMETPRFRLTLTHPPQMRTGQPTWLDIELHNEGYGPARAVTVSLHGEGIAFSEPEHTFQELAVGQTQTWEKVPVTPGAAGSPVLEITLSYERYRSGVPGSAAFKHLLEVQAGPLDALNALPPGARVRIEKFFSPGAISNEIEIADAPGTSIGSRIAPAQEEHMDPITLIVTALVSGLTAGLTAAAQSAVKDSYEALKAALQKKTENAPAARQALETVIAKPESKPRQEVLAEELRELKAAEDEHLLQLAKQLLAQVQPQPGGGTTVSADNRSVAIGGNAIGNVIITGDQNQVTR